MLLAKGTDTPSTKNDNVDDWNLKFKEDNRNEFIESGDRDQRQSDAMVTVKEHYSEHLIHLFLFVINLL